MRREYSGAVCRVLRARTVSCVPPCWQAADSACNIPFKRVSFAYRDVVACHLPLGCTYVPLEVKHYCPCPVMSLTPRSLHLISFLHSLSRLRVVCRQLT